MMWREDGHKIDMFYSTTLLGWIFFASENLEFVKRGISIQLWSLLFETTPFLFSSLYCLKVPFCNCFEFKQKRDLFFIL